MLWGERNNPKKLSNRKYILIVAQSRATHTHTPVDRYAAHNKHQLHYCDYRRYHTIRHPLRLRGVRCHCYEYIRVYVYRLVENPLNWMRMFRARPANKTLFHLSCPLCGCVVCISYVCDKVFAAAKRLNWTHTHTYTIGIEYRALELKQGPTRYSANAIKSHAAHLLCHFTRDRPYTRYLKMKISSKCAYACDVFVWPFSRLPFAVAHSNDRKPQWSN